MVFNMKLNSTLHRLSIPFMQFNFFLQKSSPIKLNDVDPTPFSDLTEEFRDIRYTSVGTSGVDIGVHMSEIILALGVQYE